MSKSRGPAAGQSPAQVLARTATRRLCAGVYADPQFRDMVIRRVHNDTSRRVAPSYGFDLVAVVQHAWRAWVLDAAQQICLLAVFVVAVILSPASALIVACAAGGWWLAGRALPVVPEFAALRGTAAAARALRRPALRADVSRLRELERLLLLSAAGCAALAAIAAIAAASPAPRLLLGAAGTAALLAVVLVAVCALTGAVRQMALNRLHRAGSLRRPWVTRRIVKLEEQQDCEYVVYRRSPPVEPPGKTGDPDRSYQPVPYQLVPFTGAGKLVHRWLPPLNIQLLRPGQGRMDEREHVAAPFPAHELAEHLKMAMAPLGAMADTSRMRGFRICDRLYIAEEDVPADRDFLQGPVKTEEINRILDDPHATAQHFLEMRVSTSGEVVTTVFVRVTVRGRALSIDFTTCALTRTPDEYGRLDEYGENGTGAVIRAALRGIGDVPVSVARLWRLPEIPWVLAGAWQARKDQTLTPQRGKRIGSQISVREDAACPSADAGHDRVTIYDEMKIIEKRLLKATEDFLKAREVDTSMFERLTFSIINSGFLNMGQFHAGQGAFGQGAQFHNQAGEQDGSTDGPAGTEGD
jgi:hypothetical protein